MSSFQNFFNEDFLLSSCLKPKTYSDPNKDVSKSKKPENFSLEDASTNDANEYVNLCQPSSEQKVKRVCLDSELKEKSCDSLVNLSAPIKFQPVSQANSTASVKIPVNSLSDQILQIRIKLQIYQKEYAHFVENANRSSLQIQETLEELHRLVNLNFESQINQNNLELDNGSASNQTILSDGPPQVSENNSKKEPESSIPREILISSVKHRPRAFPRKPRCLLFNSMSDSFSDTMITSSLDGSVQIWSKNYQKIQSSIFLPSFLHKSFFVEDLCWDRRTNGLLALGICESSNSACIDDSNGLSSGKSDRQIGFLKFDPLNPTSTPRFISSNISPHDRNISVIESWSSGKHSDKTSHFLTGGLDKSIFSWRVEKVDNNYDFFDISSVELHRRHTNSVQSICYDWINSDIWSGGADCRLVQWSGEENRLVNEIKWDSRISHLIKSKTHSDLILATVMTMSSQLRLFDRRVNNIVNSFGTQETVNLSRYSRPSWHFDGNLIANGTLSPADSMGSINIWDIRMMNSSSNSSNAIKPVKVINCEDRRLLRAEFAPDGRSIVGMSTDGAMTFIEFSY